MPFERTHVVLFYDRVLRAALPEVVPHLLGHVLAHEIVHMLQGVERHSNSGVMKPYWDDRDYAEMLGARLKFTKDDIDLIHRGLEWRASRAARGNHRPQYDDLNSNGDESRAPAANRGVVPPGR